MQRLRLLVIISLVAMLVDLETPVSRSLLINLQLAVIVGRGRALEGEHLGACWVDFGRVGVLR